MLLFRDKTLWMKHGYDMFPAHIHSEYLVT